MTSPVSASFIATAPAATHNDVMPWTRSREQLMLRGARWEKAHDYPPQIPANSRTSQVWLPRQSPWSPAC